MKVFLKNNLKYLIIFLLPILLTVLLVRWVDNDSWFVLAEGREIATNGIYKTDMLSMHSDLAVTVQNYGFAVIFWWIYSLFGLPGLYVGMLICLLGVEILLYKIFMLLSKKNEKLSLVLMVVASSVLSLAFATTRAQMVSYVFFLLVIYLLELYAQSGKTKFLWAIPILSLVQINLHASLWLMLFLVMGVFFLDALIERYKAKPIVIIGIISALAGLINPYGIEMITFVVKSYTGGAIQRLVSEMKPFSLSSWDMAVVFGSIVMVLVLGFYGDKKKIRVRYLLLFFGLLGLGLNTVKGMSQVLLVMFMSIIGMYADAKWWPKIKNVNTLKAFRIGEVVFSVILVGIVGWKLVDNLSGLKEGPDQAMVSAVDKLDELMAEEDRAKMKVYSAYNDGGYLEFRGYKPYLDPRAEVFLKVNNGKEDILVEWIDLQEGMGDRDEFMEKYDFDYIVTRGRYDPLHRDELKGYEKVFESEDTETRVFRRA